MMQNVNFQNLAVNRETGLHVGEWRGLRRPAYRIPGSYRAPVTLFVPYLLNRKTEL